MITTETRPTMRTHQTSSSLASNASCAYSSASYSSNSSISSSIYTEAEDIKNSPAYNYELLPRHLQDPVTRDYPLQNPGKDIDVEECLSRKPLAHTFGAMLAARGRELQKGLPEDVADREEKDRKLREERRRDMERVKGLLRATATGI